VSRRNIASLSNFPGSGLFQEPSSRDLDVGFAVGVKDDGNDSDLLINNHSLQLPYSPTSNTGQPNPASYVAEEPPSSTKELNIGVLVDPKNGVSYYTPGYLPRNSLNTEPNVYDIFPDSTTFVHSISKPYPVTVSSLNPFLVNPSQQSPLKSHFNFGPYPITNPIPNYLDSSSVSASNLNGFPYPYQMRPKQTLGSDGYSRFTPLQTFSANVANRFSNPDQLQQTTYPYQQPFGVASELRYSPKSFSDTPNQFVEPFYEQPVAVNGLDSGMYPENYQFSSSVGRYPEIYEQIPYGGTDMKYSSSLRNLQNVFRIEEQVPKGYYREFVQPVAVNKEQEQPVVIMNQQGTPLMTVQPYGDRQVGTFRLRNDHGYQVLVSQYDELKSVIR